VQRIAKKSRRSAKPAGLTLRRRRVRRQSQSVAQPNYKQSVRSRLWNGFIGLFGRKQS
jgi:hypothetical protein